MTDLQYAEANLATIERQGKFFAGLVKFYDEAAAKWEEFSGEQFTREVEGLKCQDIVDALKLEWKRAKAKVNALRSHPSTERKDGE